MSTVRLLPNRADAALLCYDLRLRFAASRKLNTYTLLRINTAASQKMIDNVEVVVIRATRFFWLDGTRL